MISTILLAIPGLVLVWILVTYVDHLISLRRYPKGPFPLPLIGNILLLSDKPFFDFLELAKTYGDVFSLSLGMQRVVVINSYDKIHEGLVQRGHDIAGRPHDDIPTRVQTDDFRSIGGLDYSKEWAFIRKLTYKSLHMFGSGMKKIEDVVNEEAEKMCDLLRKDVGDEILLDPFIGNTIVNVIFHLLFSKKYNENDVEFQHILKYNRWIAEGLGPDQFICIFPWLRFFPKSTRFNNLKTAVKLRNKHTHDLLQHHMDTFNSDKIRDVTDSILVLSRDAKSWQKDGGFQHITQTNIEALLSSLYFAAIETSFSTLRWFFVYIVSHPECQTKMVEEIVEKHGLKKELVYEDIKVLPYVQAVMLETSRHASIARIGVPHKAIVDTVVGGVAIPKGYQVLFNLYSVHYDPIYWDQPELFKPERWLNSNGSLKTEKVTHYLPFSAGTRVCPGEKLAKTQMFLIVAKLLINFEILPTSDETRPTMDMGATGLAFAPKKEYKVILSRRK